MSQSDQQIASAPDPSGHDVTVSQTPEFDSPNTLNVYAIQRLWDLALHEDKILNGRLNFLVASESLLLLLAGTILAFKPLFALPAYLVPGLCIIAIIVTFLSALTINIHRSYLNRIVKQLIVSAPEFRAIHEYDQHSFFNAAARYVIYITPALFGFIWACLLFLFTVTDVPSLLQFLFFVAIYISPYLAVAWGVVLLGYLIDAWS